MKKLFYFISVLFIFTVNSALYAQFSGGTGTLADPWQITSLAELDSVRNYPDSNFILMNDLDFAGSVYDSTNSTEGWEPIGSSTIMFTGSFNGAGHAISNLYINKTFMSYVGLFGYVENAFIDSLAVLNCNISGYDNTGGLAGIISSSSTVSNCYTSGIVSGRNFVGGLIGYNSSSVVSNTYSSCNVSGTDNIGGLTGKCNNGSVMNSYSSGSSSGKGYIGGLVGYNSSSSVSNCYTAANVSGSSNHGGFVGYNNNSTISNGYYNIETSGQGTAIGYDNNSQTATGLTTAGMKQQSNFAGFNFGTDWTITNGQTFPRLLAVYNNPVILHDLSTPTTVNVQYIDTVHVVSMDNGLISVTLENTPDGMLFQDNIITWTPDSPGYYNFDLKAVDINGAETNSSYTISVVIYNGKGTASDPFQVTTLEELDGIREIPDKHYRLMNDLDFTGSVYDSTNSTEGWDPIGNSTVIFTGSFNGAGHAISNLYINRPSSDYISLFGYIENAFIDSLAIINCDITGQDYTGGLVGNNSSSTVSNCYVTGNISGDDYTGGLVGYNNSCTVLNCYSTGNVYGNWSVGGLAGIISSSSTVSNSYSTARVSGVGYVGGLVGDNSSSTVSSCYATGRVSGNKYTGGFMGENNYGSIINGYYNTETSGQIPAIGYDNKSQVVTGLTTIEMEQSIYFPGFDFGTEWDIIEGSTFPRLSALYDNPVLLHNISTIAKVNVQYVDIVYVISMENELLPMTMENSPDGMQLTTNVITWTPDSPGYYNFDLKVVDDNGAETKTTYTILVLSYQGEGTETDPYQVTTLEELNMVREMPDSNFILMNDLDFAGSLYDITNSTEGWEPIGNSTVIFTGSFNGSGHTISNLYINRPSDDFIGLFGYTKNVRIDSLAIINSSITGQDYTGGLVGNNSSSSTISNCYATGSVSGQDFTGGLVGANSSSTVSNCYTTGSVSGRDYTGGLAGTNSSSTISNCYATGSVTGNKRIGGLAGNNSSTVLNCYVTGSVSGQDYTGGLVGYNYSPGIISNGYYNTETSGQSTGIGYDNNSQSVTGLISAQMKQQSNFTGFDFGTGWDIINGHTFPRLLALYDNPVILNDLSNLIKTNIQYIDTIHIVPMDHEVISVTLENAPDGMLLQDTIITWTPGSAGYYTFSIKAIDDNGATTTCTHTISTVSYQGEGTKTDPYQVTTLKELNMVREHPDKHYRLMNDLDFAGSVYDSINSVEGWEPIGNSTMSFTGSFNGAGHTINNLYINRASADYMGLFGYIDNAILDSLSVINCSVSAQDYVGGLVGYNSNSILSNSYATGNVAGHWYIGGLAGYNSYSTLTNSNATVRVFGQDYIGGLVGYNSYSILSNSYATGNVAGHWYIGGLVGRNVASTVSNCYATGKVSGQYSTGGFMGLSIDYATVTNCYATGNVYGIEYAGGFVGYNSSTDLTNCYATGRVSGETYIGGLVGYNYFSGTVSNGYYNIETSGQSTGIGYDYNSQTVTGLTTAQMKQQSSFSGFDFNTDWGIRIDSTYPALRALNNASFTFADTLISGASKAFSELMANDYDYENIRESLVLKVISVDTGYVNQDRIYFPSGAENGDTLRVEYQMGEVMTIVPDTLWGNSTTSILILNNSTPVLTSVNDKTTPEDTPVTLSVSDVTATDAEGDALSLIVYAGENYTVDGSTITPAADYYGTLSVPVSVTDGVDTSNIMDMNITVTPVNDAPVLSAVSDKTTMEDTPVTLSVSDVTATDAEGDALSLVVYAGENYTVDGSAVTPDADYYGTLSVPLSVTDGIDTSNVMNMIITVTEVTSTPEISRTDIQIYPNPVKESFRIIGIEKATEVILVDITGQVVLAKEISCNDLIPVGSLQEGIYYLVVKGENTIVKKICIY